MIDIFYYAMLKYFKEYHDIINNYNNHKNITKPEDFDKLLYEKMEKYKIGLAEAILIFILDYVIFALIITIE